MVSSIVPALLNAIIGLIVLMALYGYVPALIFMVAVGALIFGSTPIIRRHQARQQSSMEAAMGSFGALQNTLELWRESRSLGVGDFLRQRYRDERSTFEERARATYKSTGMLQVFQALVISAGIFGMVCVYALLHPGDLAAADLVAIIGISVATLVPLQSLGFGVSSLSTGSAQIRQSESVLEGMGLDGNKLDVISHVIASGRASLSVRNFHCESLKGGHALGIDSFTARIGRISWVLGPSGSGKSVFLDGLAGLVPVKEGSIDFSGPETAAPSIGYLRQSAPVLASDLLDNVDLGRKKGKAAMAALKNLEVLSMDSTEVSARKVFPRGNGSRLSGGQERRMLLARVLLNDPAVLICDEPTAGLDRESRAIVWRLLDQESRNRVVIVATHDPEAPMRETDSSLDIVNCVAPHVEIVAQ